MKIEFQTLHISNFMSIGEATIDLNNQGYVTIEGLNINPDDRAESNGSGKSSIFEAIVWCLTGNTIRGNKNVVNTYGDGTCKVTLKLKVDNHEYIIERGIK